MNLYESITQQRLQEILFYTYKKVADSEINNITDLIEDIKHQLLVGQNYRVDNR